MPPVGLMVVSQTKGEDMSKDSITTPERPVEWHEADRLAAIIFDKHWGDNHPAMRKLLHEALEKSNNDGYRKGLEDAKALELANRI